MHSRVVAVCCGVFIGLMFGRLLPSPAPVNAAVPLASEPLTRAVVLNREPCECTRYRLVALPGSDHVAVIPLGGDPPTGQGGIAKPENIP